MTITNHSSRTICKKSGDSSLSSPVGCTHPHAKERLQPTGMRHTQVLSCVVTPTEPFFGLRVSVLCRQGEREHVSTVPSLFREIVLLK